jgi:hypothetical protein
MTLTREDFLELCDRTKKFADEMDDNDPVAQNELAMLEMAIIEQLQQFQRYKISAP